MSLAVHTSALKAMHKHGGRKGLSACIDALLVAGRALGVAWAVHSRARSHGDADAASAVGETGKAALSAVLDESRVAVVSLCRARDSLAAEVAASTRSIAESAAAKSA